MNEKNFFSNERISASAGSGKTFSLTSRFIALSAMQRNIKDENSLPNPKNIIALTFTRKSAGEFLIKILTRLATSINNDKELIELENSIRQINPGIKINNEFANTLLAEFVKNIDKLKLSTIDAFFASTLKLFANEVGIYRPIELVDIQEEKEIKSQIIEKILKESDFTKDEFRNFLSIIKNLNGFSNEVSSLSEDLQKAIDLALDFDSNLNPNVNIQWANSKIIKSNLQKNWDQNQFENEIENLNKLAQKFNFSKQLKPLFTYLKNCSDNKITAIKKDTLPWAIINKIRQKDLNKNSAIEYKKISFTLPAEISLQINKIFTMLFDTHLIKYLSVTEIMHSLVKKYKKYYKEEFIDNGKLNFKTIIQVLNSNPYIKKLLDFRLDAKFDHWLFDEFQDTSQEQWEFFASIIDEFIDVQEKSPKSFYYVGDIKQSIYSWRGGDKNLFNDIFNKYKNHKYNPIKEANDLNKSWRSCQSIITAVNLIFAKDDLSKKLLEQTFSKNSANEFSELYKEHQFAKKDTLNCSLAQLKIIGVNKENAQENLLYKNVLEIINSLKNTSQTIAILVSTNAQIQEISEFLTQNNIQVAPEGEKPIANNSFICSAFIQILQFIAHPNDTASLEYLKMTVFKDSILQDENFREKSLEKLSNGKYVEFFKEICKSTNLKINYYQNLLLQALREFEASPKTGIDNLIIYLQNKKTKLTSNSNYVQIMSIHKSKGLEFDIVILPHLENLEKQRKTSSLQIFQNKKGEKTIFYMPPKSIISLDLTLENANKNHIDNEAYENICKLYVALTRAKNALYIIKTQDEQKDETPLNALLINAFKNSDLQETDNCLIYSIGNKKWFENIKQSVENEKNKENINLEIPKIEKIIDEEILPEKINPSIQNKSYELSLNNHKSLELGTSIHKVLEQIYFIKDEIKFEIKKAMNLTKINKLIENEISEKLEHFFANNEILKYFSFQENLEIKNEFSFYCHLENIGLCSGKIDRLILEKNNSKHIIKATIIDYKANFLDNQISQLSLYKKAVQSIYNLKNEDIKTIILDYNNFKIINL